MDIEVDESDEDVSVQPAKKKKGALTDFFDKVPPAKAAVARKASGASKPPPAKKAPAKKKADSDVEENSMVIEHVPLPPPRAAPSRAARAAPKQAYIDVGSDDEGNDSIFVDE
jgi:DNA topoisomerase-2